MLRVFDELGEGRISTEYDTYFGEMDLSDEEKKRRIELAKELEILFLFLFMQYKEEDSEKIKKILQEKYKDIATEFTESEKESSYISEYSKKIIEEIIKATKENIKDPYYTSWDRAIFIAENEANTIGNYKNQMDAIKHGKKYKTWITMNDAKVRHTHKEVNNVKIPIFEAFKVGNSEMMFPKDESLKANAEEIVNCRCMVHYT